MRPGESTVLPFRQSTPRSPPGARSAIRQLHQSALFPRLLDPIFWVPQPRVLIQPPWVTGRLRPGPPRSGPRLGRTSHPASSSPVSAGGPRPWPRVAPLHHPSECVFRWATRTQTASPPQLVASAGNLSFLQPPGCLNLQPCTLPRPRSRACPLCSSGVARIQCLSLRAPLQCAISPGPPRSPPAPPPPPESPLGASRCSVPSAHSPPRFAAPRKAAASAACPDPRTPKSLTGRFGTPGVAAGAHTRSALSSGPRKASGPPQPTAPPKAATPILFLPPVLFRGRPHPVAQSPCASAVRDLTWAPWPPPAPPPPPESLLGASRCSVPSAHSPLRLSAPRKAAASAACSDPQTPKSRRADSAPPGSPQGPTHARPPPLVSPRSLDLIRPGEGTILTFYSPAPPELRVQACAISGSLATPPLKHTPTSPTNPYDQKF
ncbi:hypothetical protein NDU88_003671 [Pleurodeles waltl]|uniref:Uncharacterized protein n=1 Tax=Pleurodeles waltl TaxID=8319 RepID=A0AAV7WQ31_PLEWA|nr:hypothetical protein NDU88_003671 [Pleurodeles waltl]